MVYAHRSFRKLLKEKKRFEVEVRLRIFFFLLRAGLECVFRMREKLRYEEKIKRKRQKG